MKNKKITSKLPHNVRSLRPECSADAPCFLNAVYQNSTQMKKVPADVLQYGRSMIEMLGVLAIIGVLSVGGIAGYSKAMHRYRINKTIEQITYISGNVRSLFAPQKTYLGVTCSCGNNTLCSGSTGNGDATAENGCPVIKKAKIFPEEMLTLNADGQITAITNVFGNKVSIVGQQYGSKSNFYIEQQVDFETCTELLIQDWSIAQVSSIGITGNGPGFSSKPPLDLSTALSQCQNRKDPIKLQFFFLPI